MESFVNNLRDAAVWFLENHTGTLICIKEDKEIITNCYTEASKFYNENYYIAH